MFAGLGFFFSLQVSFILYWFVYLFAYSLHHRDWVSECALWAIGSYCPLHVTAASTGQHCPLLDSLPAVARMAGFPISVYKDTVGEARQGDLHLLLSPAGAVVCSLPQARPRIC